MAEIQEHPEHLVSRIKWGTTFDDESRAKEFQERISSWSQNVMPLILIDVFEKQCPPEQFWNIQTLELDLKSIDYANLESDLSIRFRDRLFEQLAIFARQTGSGMPGSFILSDEDRDIEIIAGFLQNGVLTWNYKPKYGSVNEMFARLIQRDKRNFLDKVNEILQVDEQSRRRIAWQFTEQSITETIKSVEHENTDLVFAFTNELSRIQKEGTVVHGSEHDFRKNLWLWVLNYLFVDRGSGFNRVAFMKSSITQIARHYNVGYNDLLHKIEKAAVLAAKGLNVNADFLKTLDILITEKRPQESANIFLQHDESLTENLNFQLNGIAGYLLYGTLPAGAEISVTSIEDLFNEQIREAPESLSILLIDLAFRYEKVRMRLASLSDSVIFKIIALTEPADYNEIIEFNYELTTMQQTESLVRTGHSEFKRNLWFWIFNSLYSNAGSVFNRVEMMKSTLLQMAKNYNVEFSEILAALDKIVSDVAKSPGISDEIVQVVRYLSEVKALQKNWDDEFSGDLNTNFFWQQLDSQFRNRNERRNPANKITFNELLARLSNEDRDRFASLIFEQKNDAAYWTAIAEDLDGHSLEIMLQALNSTMHSDILVYIRFFERAVPQAGLICDRKILWKIGLQMSSGQRGVRLGNHIILNSFVKEILSKNNIATIDLLEKMMDACRAIALKRLDAHKIYDELIFLLDVHLEENTDQFFSGDSGVLLELLSSLIDSNKEATQCNSLIEKLSRRIAANPESAISFFANYPKKRVLKSTLPKLLNSYLASRILCQVSSPLNTFGSLLLRLTSDLRTSTSNSQLVAFIEVNFAKSLVEKMVYRPSADLRALVIAVFEKLLYEVPPGLESQFVSFLKQLAKHSGLEITDELISEMAKKTVPGDLKISSLIDAIEMGEVDSFDTCRLLSRNFLTEEFIQLRSSVFSGGEAISEHILPGAFIILKEIVEPAKLILSNEDTVLESEIGSTLSDRYWSCLVNHTAYNGSLLAFTRYFKSEVLFAFPRLKEFLHKSIQAGEDEGVIQFSTDRVVQFRDLPSLLDICLSSPGANFLYNGQTYHAEEIINTAIQRYPALFWGVLEKIQVSDGLILLIEQAVSFNDFCFWITRDLASSFREALRSVHLLYLLVVECASKSMGHKVKFEFWHAFLNCIKTKSLSAKELDRLVRSSLDFLTESGNSNMLEMAIQAGTQKIPLNNRLKQALAQYVPVLFTASKMSEEAGSLALETLVQGDLIGEFISELVSAMSVPLAVKLPARKGLKDIMKKIVMQHPAQLGYVLKYKQIGERQLEWISRNVAFNDLTISLGIFNRSARFSLSAISGLYEALGKLQVPGTSPEALQHILFKKVLRAWTTGNWKIISGDQVWKELIWEITIQNGISKQEFLKQVRSCLPQLSPALQSSFRLISDTKKETPKLASVPANVPSVKRTTMQNLTKLKNQGGIHVYNAGVVLINGYLPMLFDRLGLLNNREFVSIEARENAVHYLQYVITGLTYTEEVYLPLNKVLCGLPLEQALKSGIDISDKDKHTIESMIKAIIGHWPVIGASSIEGFRGNWLVRDGLLKEQEEKWEIVVEKRPYDLLINKSPFSLSMIKYPWMSKRLEIIWPY